MKTAVAQVALPGNISLTDLNGQKVLSSTWQSLPVIIWKLDGSDISTGLLTSIDSLALAYKGKAFTVLVPASDFGNMPSKRQLSTLAEANCKNVSLILSPVNAKRSAGSNQHPLFKWLCYKDQNGRFDFEVKQGSQMYLLSASGKFCAWFNLDSNKMPPSISRAMTQISKMQN